MNNVGFLFQFHYLLSDFDVLENVLMPSRLAGDNLTQATELARSLLTRLGLKDRLDHLPGQLSGGEQQRAALARAMIRRPKLLLCDEPTGNLDKHHAEEMMDLLFAEVRESGTALVIVTHNEALAKRSGMSYYLADGFFQSRSMENSLHV